MTNGQRIIEGLKEAVEHAKGSGWQPIETAPKDRVLLLWGKLYGQALDRQMGWPNGPIRVTGYWDEIDDAWAAVSHTWEGPFVEATMWQDCPDPPQ